MVSHELKTLLTSLTGIIKIVGLKLKKPEDAFRGTMNKADTFVKRMSTIINGLLNISRLESSKILIHRHPFAIDEPIREVIDVTNSRGLPDVVTFDACDCFR